GRAHSTVLPGIVATRTEPTDGPPGFLGFGTRHFGVRDPGYGLARFGLRTCYLWVTGLLSLGRGPAQFGPRACSVWAAGLLSLGRGFPVRISPKYLLLSSL